MQKTFWDRICKGTLVLIYLPNSLADRNYGAQGLGGMDLEIKFMTMLIKYLFIHLYKDLVIKFFFFWLFMFVS